MSSIVAVMAMAASLHAASLPKASPEEVGLSSQRLKRVSALMQRYIEQGEIAGAVSLVARKGRVVHLEAQGVMDIDSKKPLRTDAIFRLASMTKPVTSLAVMMLHEEGRFLLDDPISKFLPEFAHPQVAIANAANERYAGGFRLVSAERPITIRQLLTHTAGLPSGTAGPTMSKYKDLSQHSTPESTMAEYVKHLAAMPLNFQPGTAWEYSPATNVLGRLVEVISGKSLDQYFQEKIFKPVDMKDTFFYLPDDRLPRLVTAYDKQGGTLRKLTTIGPEARNGKFFAGAGGLAGTVEDYARFCQMLLNGGQYNGSQVVSRKTVEFMTTSHIGSLPLWQDLLRNYGFGLGFRVRKELGDSATLGSVGEYGWGGAYGTYFWIDPKEHMFGILMIQLMPYAHLNIRPEFQNAVTAAIVD